MGDRAEELAGVADVDLAGRTVLVTGSTDGIGRETALGLGRLGATVLVHGRDREKGRRVVDRLDGSPGEGVLFLADFASQDAVEGLADSVADHGPIDVLVNNAGGFFRQPRLTPEGFEHTFGVNHLAPFLLTGRLAGSLADGARVVVTASRAHRDADGIDFDAVRTIAGYRPRQAYQRSKLANVLFTAALARRLDGATANCFHPGFVPGSGFLREVPRAVRAVVQAVEHLPEVISGRLATTVVEGAATAVYLAASPGVAGTTGRYFTECSTATPSPVARDRDLQERLWERSEEWTGLDEDDGETDRPPPR